MAIINLTDADDAQIPLKTGAITRIRKITDSERRSRSLATRIDYAYTVYVKEEAEDVAHQVATVPDGTPTLRRLTLPNGWPVWFDAAKAGGPLPVPHSSSFNSALVIGGKRQYVRESPNEVYDLISAAGGNALPIPTETPKSSPLGAEALRAAPEVWDQDIPELKAGPAGA